MQDWEISHLRYLLNKFVLIAALDAVNIHREIQRVVRNSFENDQTPGGFLLTARQGVEISDED